MSKRDRYFNYSASGSAFGGILTAPRYLTIPTKATASLSGSGGYGSSGSENFGIDGILSVRRAVTTVQGDLKQTETTITLEDINLLDVLRVGRIVMHLVSVADPKGDESWISPAGSLIEGLSIHGKEIPLYSAVDVFDRYPKYCELGQAYLEGQLDGMILNPKSLSAPCTAKVMSECASVLGDVRATLYPKENGQYIDNFGALYLGEYRISRYARRLTMLRVELGCDREGSLSFGDGAGNGHWEPPT